MSSILTHISDVKFNKNSVVTVGTFDGVHAGHQSLITKLVSLSKLNHSRSVLVTFEPHPREVINSGSNIGLLTTLEERADILKSMNLDLMVVIPFTRDFSLLSSEKFIKDFVYQKIGVSHFVIGYDHQFGKNREGTRDTVIMLGEKLNFKVHIIEAHEVKDKTVSSTGVRKALAERGDLTLVKHFLGHNYKLQGTVIKGDQRGRTIGFPTANLKINNPKKVIPFIGVYAVNVFLEGIRKKGMMNIGFRPTFENGVSEPVLEVHIFDFNEDIYGKTLTVEFIKRLRDERKFNKLDELINQLKKDRQIALQI